MLDLIVSVPDHCLSVYLAEIKNQKIVKDKQKSENKKQFYGKNIARKVKTLYTYQLFINAHWATLKTHHLETLDFSENFSLFFSILKLETKKAPMQKWFRSDHT